MPSRNIVKMYESESFYHVYSRGVDRQVIFRDVSDKHHFLKIIARHLDPSDSTTKTDGARYDKFDNSVELLCYCLMDNHFHLLIYLKGDSDSVGRYMRAVLTAYTMYFNKKYMRQGPLFQSVYKASRISHDSYLTHISRYIHMNPYRYKTYEFSSLMYYLGQQPPIWLKTNRILEIFDGDSYLKFLEDYEGQQFILAEAKRDVVAV